MEKERLLSQKFRRVNETSKVEKSPMEIRLDKFFQRLQEKDLVVNSEGMKKKIKTVAGKKTINEMLTATISRWKYNPVDWYGMRELEQVIDLAFLNNAISEGEGLISKNRKAQEKNSTIGKGK